VVFLDIRRSDSVDDVTSIVLDPKEINLKVSERQRCRFLRNVSSPYDTNGRWRKKNDSLKKIKRKMRKTSAARSAFFSWLNFFLLSLLLFLVVGHFSINHNEKYSQNAILKQWLKDGFSVDQNLHICPKSRNESGSLITFSQISDLSTWQNWMKEVFPQLNKSGIPEQVSDQQNENCNTVMLSFIEIKQFGQTKESDCKSLPLAMQKILADESYFKNNLSGISSFEANPQVNFVNLAQFEETPDFSFESDKILDGIELDFVVYNKITHIYSLVQAYFPFSNPFLITRINIYSVFLDSEQSMSSVWILIVHLPLMIWAIVQGLSGLFFLTEKNSWIRIRKRSQVDNKSVKVVDLALWITIVGYVSFASILRLSISKSAEVFEKSAHLYKDPQSVIDEVLRIEFALIRILCIWTVLLVVKLLNIATTHHGFRSKFTRGISAVYISFKRSFAPLIDPLFVIILIICVLNFFNSFWFYGNPDVAAQLFPKAVFHFWLNLSGKMKEFTADTFFNSKVNVLFYVLVFIGTHIVFKGLLIASHQWYFRRFKIIPPKMKEKVIQKQDLKTKAKPTNCKLTSKTLVKSYQLQRSTSQNVTFTELFQENVKDIRYAIGIVCSSLIYTTNRTLGCSLHGLWRCVKFQQAYQESSDEMTSQNQSETANHVSFADCDYDKSKVDDEFWTSDLVKSSDSVPTHATRFFDCYKENGKNGSNNYTLPTETALSEVNTIIC